MIATDEGQQQTIDPTRFPIYKLKRLFVLGGFYRSNVRHGDVSGDETFFGIPYAALERAELSEVVTVVQRTLRDRLRHHLTAKHFPVMLAMECGIILEPAHEWRYAFPDKPKKVMDDYETARLFHLSESTAREYREAMIRALDEQWFWLMTRER